MAARKKKRPGRPRMKRSDVRRHRVQVSLSDRDRKRLRELAKHEGTPVAQLMYDMLKRELERREASSQKPS